MNEKENEIDAQKSRIMKLIVLQKSPKPSPLSNLDGISTPYKVTLRELLV
jgi:hypothetical protein